MYVRFSSCFVVVKAGDLPTEAEDSQLPDGSALNLADTISDPELEDEAEVTATDNLPDVVKHLSMI